MQLSPRISRRRALALLSGAAVACVLPACESGGHFTVLGYTTRPNYDCSIRTVRVPIFNNHTFRQGLEFDLTRAVVREIEAKTPYKVVSHCNADTELTGTIKGLTKNILNMTQLNEIREGETILTVEVVWKDLRTGKILSAPPRKPGEPLPIEVLADPALSGPGNPLPPTAASPPAFPTSPVVAADGQTTGPAILTPDAPDAPKPPPPMLLTSRGNFIPELGQSLTSSMQLNVNRMAIQIVNMMEKPW